jgi:hypothetical protein
MTSRILKLRKLLLIQNLQNQPAPFTANLHPLQGYYRKLHHILTPLHLPKIASDTESGWIITALKSRALAGSTLCAPDDTSPTAQKRWIAHMLSDLSKLLQDIHNAIQEMKRKVEMANELLQAEVEVGKVAKSLAACLRSLKQRCQRSRQAPQHAPTLPRQDISDDSQVARLGQLQKALAFPLSPNSTVDSPPTGAPQAQTIAENGKRKQQLDHHRQYQSFSEEPLPIPGTVRAKKV